MNHKEKQKKIAIFGGSFDPPHFGHVDIVRNLEKAFDAVIVVPSFISPFKSGAADAAVRFKIAKAVFSSEKTTVLKREISRGGISYSVDTAAYLAKKYKDCSLHWVIGSEEAARLLEWHDIDRLKKLVRFLIVPRSGYALATDCVKTLKKHGVSFKIANFCGADISSSRIKIDLAFGKPNAFLPDRVFSVVKSSGVFNPYAGYVAELYNSGLSAARIAHSYRTACRGAYLAKLYGASISDAVTACILHDIGKEKNIDDYKSILDLSEFPEPCAHAAIGAHIASALGVSQDVVNAIYRHSTADKDMTVLDEVVYLADKTESGRKYGSFEYLCFLCGVDKNLAMIYAINELNVKNADARECRLSSDAYEYYLAKFGGVMPEMPPLPKAHSYVVSDVSAQACVNTRKPEKSVQSAKREKINDNIELNKSVISTTPSCFGKYNPDIKLSDNGEWTFKAAHIVADELSLHKASDVIIVELGDKTIVADYFIIATASSTTAVKSLCDYVEDKLNKQFGLNPSRRDIDKEWAALDYGGIIIHVFTQKTREFYNIERLWSDGKNVESVEE